MIVVRERRYIHTKEQEREREKITYTRRARTDRRTDGRTDRHRDRRGRGGGEEVRVCDERQKK